jgi:hypothetical protein
VFSNTDGGGFALRVKDGLLQADVRTWGLGVFQTFGPTVPLNAWSHVAMTYDYSQVQLYLNGQLVGSAPASGAISTSGNANTCPMIGNEPDGCNVQNSGFGFVGSIDEVEIFNRALTLSEIQGIVNSGNSGKCKSDYPNTSVPLSTNATVTPDTAPINATSIGVSASTNFKGKLEGDPVTGVVRVTDAHPAGTYTVTVTAFDAGGTSTTKTFTLTVTTPATCTPVNFAAATNFGTSGYPYLVAVGDFNGDGKQDLVVANLVSVAILLGDGAGNFSAATNFGAGLNIYSVAVGDFNGDGKQDLAVANSFENSVAILLGNGAGSFSAATNFLVGNSPYSVTVGDFNSDGRQDLATANYNSGNVSILIGNGAGSFAAATNFGVGSAPVSLVVGDFNGDGKQDLAAANQNSNNASILLGDGTGSFSAATNFGVGTFPSSVAVGDFNSDSQQDLVVANAGSNDVSILLGNGAGSFSAATNFGAGAYPHSVAVGDFNGDGKQDLAVADYNSHYVSMLLGDGAGSFSAATTFAAGGQPESVAVGDFNGDGRQDLVNVNSNQASVLLRDCATGQMVQVTLQTNPAGLEFTADGTSYTGSQTFSWAVGSHHTIGTSSPQSGGAGTRYVYDSWNDGGLGQTHSITVPAVAATYTAFFDTQYLLTMGAGTGGTVGPASGYHNSAAVVSISATPNIGYNFTGWTGSGSGSYSGLSNPASVTMNGPVSETGNFALAPSPTCVSPPPNMLAWLPGDGNANDIAGTNNGTLVGGAAFGLGEVGQAFSFTGGGSAMRLPQAALRQNFTAFTVDAWIFPTTSGHATSPASYGLTIFSNTDGGGFALRVKDGSLQADVRTQGTSVFQTFGPPVPLNTWSHVAMTYDGSNLRMYLNGQLVGSAPAGGGISTNGNANTCPMIGNEPDGCNVQQSGFGFVGSIDELEVFGRALQPAEIQTIFNAGTAGKCKPAPAGISSAVTNK